MNAIPVLEGRLHPLAAFVIARRFIGAGALPVLVLAVSAGARVIAGLVLGVLVALAFGVLAWWRFRYRVVVHDGAWDAARTDAAWEDFTGA